MEFIVWGSDIFPDISLYFVLLHWSFVRMVLITVETPALHEMWWHTVVVLLRLDLIIYV